jgi:hypothetical protein
VVHAGEVQALVEVALRGGAVADERAGHAGLSLQLEPPGDARGVRDLRPEGDLRGEAEDAVGDVAAVGVAPPVHHHLLEELVPEGGHPHELAVVGREPVVGEVERPDDPDDGRLLAGERGHREDAALALEVPEPLRRPARDQHVFEEMTVELGVGSGAWAVGRRAGCRSQFGHR